MGEVRTPRTGAEPLAGEQVASVAAVHRRFARMAGESLTTLARTSFQLRLAAAQRLPCREFRARAAQPAALASISLDPLPGAALCLVDRPLAFLLIDRLLGGSGAPAVPDRGLSEIEGTVLRRAIAALLPGLQHAWEPVCAVVARLEYLERQADTADLLAADARLLCATFAVTAGAETGHLYLAQAEASLEAIGGRLLARQFPPRQSARAAAPDARLTVELGAGSVRSDGGGALDEGMVIGLHRFAGEPAAIEMNSRPVARGQVVALDDSIGIRVTEVLAPSGLNDPVNGGPADK
jgi:flagellar motor switch protein FliM